LKYRHLPEQMAVVSYWSKIPTVASVDDEQRRIESTPEKIPNLNERIALCAHKSRLSPDRSAVGKEFCRFDLT